MRKAIILCSGGLDSVVTAHYVKKKLKYKKMTILFFDYGQRSLSAEKKYSKICARNLGAEFVKIKVRGLEKISASLINSTKKAKKISTRELKDTSEESKKWYVPCRNIIFASYAMALADSFYKKEKIRGDIIFGFKCEGKESYPDATEDFVHEINKVARTSSESSPQIIAPLIKLDKEEVIKIGSQLKVDFSETFSCYVGTRIHCGTCLACKLRQQGFYWAGVEDNTKYCG